MLIGERDATGAMIIYHGLSTSEGLADQMLHATECAMGKSGGKCKDVYCQKCSAHGGELV